MNTEAEATSGADGGAVSKGAGSGSGAVLLNQPIVIDTGTGSVKAGFAGGSKPKVRAYQRSLDITENAGGSKH
eukprot:10894523-Ditylum_brightwellii.AAC.2